MKRIGQIGLEATLTLFGPSPADVLPRDGFAVFHPTAFTPEEADRLFQALTVEPDWKQETIRMFGRMVDQPRLTAWHGDAGRAYTYSGITLDPKPWTPAISEVRARLEDVAATNFNSVLLNLYRDGRDSVSWHSDDEADLGPEPVIGSVSFGATRRFVFRHRTDKGVKTEIELAHGSVLVMGGRSQACWEHQIPRTAARVGSRINLTFRTVRR